MSDKVKYVSSGLSFPAILTIIFVFVWKHYLGCNILVPEPAVMCANITNDI